MNAKTKSDRILVVDDEPANIWPLVKHLETDFEILCATEGEQALQIARSPNKPDLILLDIIMPGMDGYDVFDKLKADDATRDIPVIFLTAIKEEIDETKGLELGAEDYITKPFSLPVVRARIKSVLNLRKELKRRLLLKTRCEALNTQLEKQVQEKMAQLQEAKEALKHYEEKYSKLFRDEVEERKTKRILVVDDKPENVHILVHNLEAQYELICADNGETALECAFSDKPTDLILLDIMMPGMDGFEVCSRLKAAPDTRDIPIIFITALDQEVDEAKGLHFGAVDFITKPFSIPIVAARIKAALRLKEEMDKRITLARRLENLNQDLEARVKAKTAALKRAHSELEASENKYRGIYENAPEGIFQVSYEGRYLSANPALARILGYASPEELLTHLTDVQNQLYVKPEKRDDLMRRLEDQEAVSGHELQLYKKDKQIVWVSISARVVRDEAGEPMLIEGFLTDINERKSLEEQLRQAAKMEAIGNLVGGVAHDFNNLMTAVIGYSDMLHLSHQADGESCRAIGRIKKAGESAAALTKQLLAFSRKQVLQPIVMDLNEAVSNTQKMLQRMIREDIKLIARLAPGLGRVLADPSQIEQVIINLAINARDAIPQSGELIIETANVVLDEAYCREQIGAQPGPYVLLVMSDNGIGMDAETLSHIFEPFFTTKQRDKGTGLGLATVYGIVKQSGGHISVDSEPGRGSTFKVYFPVTEMEAPEPAQRSQAPQTYHGNETIVVAEDNALVRDLAVAILEAHGYTVIAADSAQACLRKVTSRTSSLDLLLTDVVMPDLDGKALAQKVTEKYPGLKVLFMSGYTENVIVQHGELDKGAHFIQKPFAAQALVAKVRELLNSDGVASR